MAIPTVPRTRTRAAVTTPAPETAPVSRVRSRAAAPALPMKNATTATAITTVERTFSDGRAKEIEKNIQQFPTDIPAIHGTVHVGAKITLSPKQFESTSVSIGLWMPCLPTEEGAQATYAAMSEWVERRMKRELDLAEQE